MATGKNGVGGIGLLPATAYIVAANAAAQAILDAQVARARYGNLVGLCSGANDDVKIAAAIAAATKGLVYLSEGEFDVGGLITHASNIAMHGSGPGTIVKQSNGANLANLITIPNGAQYLSIAHMIIDGNPANNGGSTTNLINFAGTAEYPEIIDVGFGGARGIGIIGTGSIGGLLAERVRTLYSYFLSSVVSLTSIHSRTTLKDCSFGNSLVTGTWLTAAAVVLAGIAMVLDNVDTYGAASGFDIEASSQIEMINCRSDRCVDWGVFLYNVINSKFVDNTVYGVGQNGSANARAFRLAGNVSCSNNTFEGNNIIDSAGEIAPYTNDVLKKGYSLNANSNYNNIRGGQIIGSLIPSIEDSGTGNRKDHIVGYVTEASGSSTGTGAQQTIPHTLDFTPTSSQIALWDIEVGANAYHSAPPDATNIYVTAVLNQDWGWAKVGK